MWVVIGLLAYLLTHSSSSSAIRDTSADNAAITALSPASSTNQKIGLLEYDTFHPNDVTDWLALLHGNPALTGQFSEVNVNGGVSTPGSGESEVLLDVETAMALDPLPTTSYVVYDAPMTTSLAQIFNAMINDHATVIGNSWTECEDQVSLSDAQGIDSVLAQAAASGISVFNASGDTGSTCFDGSPDTVGVPADSPHATAVGGTTATSGLGLTYGGETWWNGTNQNPPTGQGGFGVSHYFARPAYQNGFITSSMRSVPDLAVIADPRDGMSVCQADAGGCPTGLLYGGTSMAAPEMAAETALLNQALGHNVGEVNPVLYPLASTPNAFHTAASMGSDFAHVGLGDPNLDYIRLALSHQTIGPASLSASLATSSSFVPADGTTQGLVQVNLYDASDYPVADKTVTLTHNAGSHAIVSAASGPSSINGGAVIFTVTDTVPETVTFTVKDTTDNVTLTSQPTIHFVPPPATSGSIEASPGTVPADGTSQSTVTVTLKNAKGQGAEGKTILLSQGSGHAVLTGSGVTDSNGVATFQATDLTAESVTFTAVDVTDGNLPVPGSATVTFTAGNGGNNCPLNPPIAGVGFAVSTFASGFYDGNLAHLAVCGGVAGGAFDGAGNLYVPDIITGDIFKFGPTGGVATGKTRLTPTALGPWLIQVAFGKNGDLYALQTFVPNTSNGQGAIYQIDPTTGAVIRTVAAHILGPTSMAVDPVSGDLFVGNGFNGGPQTPAIVRIHDPGPGNPPADCTNFSTNTSGCWTYAVPGEVDSLAFDPDGSLYARGAGTTGYNPDIWVISATNSAHPGTVTLLDSSLGGGGGISILRPEANGKRAVVAVGHNGSELDEVDLNVSPVQPVTIVTGSAGGSVGPDGCIYADQANSVLKVTSADGSCPFPPATGAAPQLRLSPRTIAPNPGTGTSVTFTVTLANVSHPQGTGVFFTVTGANQQVKLVHADAGGQATFTYTGVSTGADQVLATATAGTTPLTSTVAQVTWAAGRHVSFASLNLGPTTGQTGTPVTLRASLTDITAQPPAPIAGATLVLHVGSQLCAATTDSAGTGSCSLFLDQAPGSYTFTASYAGDAQHTPATATGSFVVTPFVGARVPAPGGWSLIDLPLTATGPISASAVLAGVLHQSGGRLAALYQLGPGGWAPALVQMGSGAPRGTDFALTPGVGYLLYSDLAGRYLQTGFVPAAQPTWTLARGWNLVGIAAGAPGPIQASAVLRGVLGQSGGHLAAVYGLNKNRWSPSLIQAGSGAPVGTDFALQPGVGYLLYTDTATSYTPRGAAPPDRGPVRLTNGGAPGGGTLPPLPPLP